MPQFSNRTLGTLTVALVVACASNETANPNAQNTGGTSGGGTAGTAPVGGGGSTALGQSGSGGTAGGAGGSGGTTPVGGFGGFAGTPAAGTGGGGTAGGGAGGGGAGGGGAGGGGAGGGGNGGGGTGGTGGTPAVIIDPCVRANWTALAVPATNANPGSNAIDGLANTRFTTGQTQGNPAADEFFRLNFPSLVTIDGVTLTTSSGNDYPRAYYVEYSTDGTTFMPVLDGDGGTLSGAGAPDTPTVIVFPDPLTLEAVRIVQTGSSAPMTSWWSIHELTVQGCVEYIAGDAGADSGDGG